jgi:general secretion pathway protein B
MSYILDALKRADAERERGTVPGLRAQPVPGVTPESQGAHARLRAWPVIVAGIALAVAVIAAGAWVWRSLAGSDRTPVVVAAAPTVPALPAAPALPPQPAPVAEPTPVATPAPAAPNAVSQAAPVTPTVPAASTTVKPKPRPEPPPSTVLRSAGTEVAPVKPSPAASAASPVLPVAPLLSELPEEIRRQIPALTITGAVASENPAQRLLLVNGQVLPQGAAAAPEVLIEEIRARSSTFKFRDSRFRVTY